jgi:hypothetical protein
MSEGPKQSGDTPSPENPGRPATPTEITETVSTSETLTTSEGATGDIQDERQRGILVRLRERFILPARVLESIAAASMLVFVLSSLAIIFVLVVYTPTTVPNLEVLRATQLLLTLAATAVILALLTKDMNAFTVVFGFLVIAALIIPTRDIIRFALIASGSEQRYSDFFPDSKDTKGQLDRTAETAAAVYVSLQDLRGTVLTDSLGGDLPARQQVVASINSVLQRARYAESFGRIAQQGAADTLKAIARDKIDEWVYRFGANDDFQGNLSYLKFEGAISFDYGDLDLIEITPYGCTLLWSFAPPRPEDPEGKYVQCPRTSSSVVDVGDMYWASLSLEANGSLLPFMVAASGLYEICAVPTASGTDPQLILLGENDVTLALNDDFAGSYGSRLAQQLKEQTEYTLDIRDISGFSNGSIDLLIKKQVTTAQPGAPCEGRLSAADVGSTADLPVAEVNGVSQTQPEQQPVVEAPGTEPSQSQDGQPSAQESPVGPAEEPALPRTLAIPPP